MIGSSCGTPSAYVNLAGSSPRVRGSAAYPGLWDVTAVRTLGQFRHPLTLSPTHSLGEQFPDHATAGLAQLFETTFMKECQLVVI